MCVFLTFFIIYAFTVEGVYPDGARGVEDFAIAHAKTHVAYAPVRFLEESEVVALGLRNWNFRAEVNLL